MATTKIALLIALVSMEDLSRLSSSIIWYICDKKVRTASMSATSSSFS